MPKRIAMFGATGLIGKRLSHELINRGDEVIIFSRNIVNAELLVQGAEEYIKCNYKNDDWHSSLNNADVVIHLAGENLFAGRWSEEHKCRIRTSRTESTQAIVNAIASLPDKPKVFVCASAVGYYGFSDDEEFDEKSKPGNNFLAEITKEWEHEAEKVTKSGIRYAGVRTGIVLAKEGGALAKMLIPYKLYIGGPFGDGKQWFPWIHIDDIVGIFLHALDNPEIKGVLNGTAPQATTMNEFCKTLGRVLKKPSVLNVPGFVLKLLYGEGANYLLNGAKVIPHLTTESGYRFKYPELDYALRSILK